MSRITRAAAAVAALTVGALAITATPAAAAPTPARIQAYITGYSWWDNTPPGSAAISDPVIHWRAGGTGTYANPITVAVGHTISGGRDRLDWPKGTRFYVPALKRYLVVEDTCGDGPKPQNGPCHIGYPRSASTWLDVWVGGRTSTARQADRCMNRITAVRTVIANPPKGYPVSTGDIC